MICQWANYSNVPIFLTTWNRFNVITISDVIQLYWPALPSSINYRLQLMGFRLVMVLWSGFCPPLFWPSCQCVIVYEMWFPMCVCAAIPYVKLVSLKILNSITTPLSENHVLTYILIIYQITLKFPEIFIIMTIHLLFVSLIHL